MLEAKFPTHGVLGVGGVVSMVLGALILVRSPLTGGGVSLAAALGVALPFAVIVIILMRFVIRSRAWKTTTGREELIGEEGEVTEPASVRPAERHGEWCGVHGEAFAARSRARTGTRLPQGVARVRVSASPAGVDARRLFRAPYGTAASLERHPAKAANLRRQQR